MKWGLVVETKECELPRRLSVARQAERAPAVLVQSIVGSGKGGEGEGRG